jgi:uncharacterized membrane protein
MNPATPRSTDPRVASYLEALTRALRGLPESVRSEVYDEIRQHIDDQLAERPGDVTAVPEIIDRLGDPADIAREAAGDQPATLPLAPAKRTHELLAVIMLEAGGLAALIVTLVLARLFGGGSAVGLSILVGIVGWLVGVVLLCTSGQFSTTDKVIGIALVPGGFAGGLALLAFELFGAVGTTTCHSGQVTSDNGHVSTLTTTCSGGTHWWVIVIAAVVAAVAIAGPVYSTIRLGRRVAAIN